MVKKTFFVPFAKNWNGKLDYPVFSTIRYFDERKFEAYQRNLFRPVLIKLNKEIYKTVRMTGLFKSPLSKLSADFIYFDSGLTPEQFYELMERFYSKKADWKGLDTMVLIIYFLSLNDLNKFKTQ